MMPIPEIEEFARILVREVRDAAVAACDMLLGTNAKGPVAQRWQQLKDAHAIHTVVPDAIDETLATLLRAIDNGSLRLTFRSCEGREIDLTEAGHGELAGWYLCSGGWRALYSEQRVVDDFADLA